MPEGCGKAVYSQGKAGGISGGRLSPTLATHDHLLLNDRVQPALSHIFVPHPSPTFSPRKNRYLSLMNTIFTHFPHPLLLTPPKK